MLSQFSFIIHSFIHRCFIFIHKPMELLTTVPDQEKSESRTMPLILWDSLLPAEAVSGNQDLITDILLRLPVKSLLRFKCVSKQWHSLISEPRFSRHYRSLASAGIIFCGTNELIHHVSCSGRNSEPPFKSLDFISDSAGIKILQSCNGLILCCSLFELGKNRNYYICNPSARQFLVLPPPNAIESDESLTIFGVHLAFDPCKSTHYQVICVRNCSPSSAATNDHYQIGIYSSETRHWRLSGSPFSAPFDMVFDNGVLWNGTIHWISPTGVSLCFDIVQEQLQEMPSLPSNEKWSKRRLRYFGESGGHLHLIEIYGAGTTEFEVFEMERDYSCWISKYQVNLAAIINAYPEMARSYPDSHDSRFYLFSILFVQENEEGSSLLLHIPGKFICYNLRDKTFKELCEFGANSTKVNTSFQHIGCFHAYQFMETLAWV
ncbi:F-box protein At5g07610-like [Argentina anserina]|uniref:F-box protein At5g07610-like n=1 Tax=Argentina anserina TaxID=57926 RepID=UPI00217660FA|nr:F-box protein At5g07610-like [Potentilla anserina]